MRLLAKKHSYIKEKEQRKQQEKLRKLDEKRKKKKIREKERNNRIAKKLYFKLLRKVETKAKRGERALEYRVDLLWGTYDTNRQVACLISELFEKDGFNAKWRSTEVHIKW